MESGSGLRRCQTHERRDAGFLELRDGCWKFHPVADWSDHDLWNYVQRYNLPYHPLWERGYVSIGDIHTTQPWQPGMRDEDTRFFGLKRECVLHY